jgi:hypothetical protein
MQDTLECAPELSDRIYSHLIDSSPEERVLNDTSISEQLWDRLPSYRRTITKSTAYLLSRHIVRKQKNCSLDIDYEKVHDAQEKIEQTINREKALAGLMMIFSIIMFALSLTNICIPNPVAYGFIIVGFLVEIFHFFNVLKARRVINQFMDILLVQSKYTPHCFVGSSVWDRLFQQVKDSVEHGLLQTFSSLKLSLRIVFSVLPLLIFVVLGILMYMKKFSFSTPDDEMKEGGDEEDEEVEMKKAH